MVAINNVLMVFLKKNQQATKKAWKIAQEAKS